MKILMKYKCDFIRIHKDIKLKKIKGEYEVEENGIKYNVFDAMITRTKFILNTDMTKTIWEQEYEVKIWTMDKMIHRVNNPAVSGIGTNGINLPLKEYWYENNFITEEHELFINITRQQQLKKILN